MENEVIAIILDPLISALVATEKRIEFLPPEHPARRSYANLRDVYNGVVKELDARWGEID